MYMYTCVYTIFLQLVGQQKKEEEFGGHWKTITGLISSAGGTFNCGYLIVPNLPSVKYLSGVLFDKTFIHVPVFCIIWVRAE